MNNNRQRRTEAVSTHQLNIQKSLQHRLEVARAKGDENLLRQLEVESEYYS